MLSRVKTAACLLVTLMITISLSGCLGGNEAELEGEIAASKLLSEIKKIVRFGDIAQKCSALAYRLFNHCEKNGLYDEARSYNGLILSWNELNQRDARKENISTIQTNII